MGSFSLAMSFLPSRQFCGIVSFISSLLFSLQCLSRTPIAWADSSLVFFLSYYTLFHLFCFLGDFFDLFFHPPLKNNCFYIYILSSVSFMDAIASFSLSVNYSF